MSDPRTPQGPDEVTRLLAGARDGDSQAEQSLWLLLYEKIHALARRKIAAEGPGLTLQATALVHEAYLRLLGEETSWRDRRHFYTAAAEAMRRILVERARRVHGPRRGGDRERVPLDDVVIEVEFDADDLLALDEALVMLSEKDRQMYEVVMLRYFSGLTVPQVAEALKVSPSTVDREWRCARLWLYEHVRGEPGR